MESSKYFIGKDIFRLDGDQSLVNFLAWTIWWKWCLRKTDVIIVDEIDQLVGFWHWLDSSGICKGKDCSLFIIIIMLQPPSVATFTIRL